MQTVAAFSTNVIERDIAAGDRSRSEKDSYRWSPRADAGWQATNVTLVDQRTEWLAAAYRKLSELAHLRADWDSYGAEAPSHGSIDVARDVLRALAQADCAPTSIDPSAEGGICLSFDHGQRYGDIECFNSGEVLAVTSHGGDDTNVWEVGGDDPNLQAALRKIRNFIGR